MLKEKIVEHFTAEGLSAASVPEVLKSAIEAAKEKNDGRALLEIARELEEYFPQKPPKASVKETYEEWDFDPAELVEGARETKRLAAKRKQVAERSVTSGEPHLESEE